MNIFGNYFMSKIRHNAATQVTAIGFPFLKSDNPGMTYVID